MRFVSRATPFFVAFLVCGLGLWLTCPAQEPPQNMRGVRPFMRMKLEASNKVLEGLTTEDFRMIRDGAQTLQRMSGAEKWRVSNDVLYRQYSAEFIASAEGSSKRPTRHNLDGATLAWVECTMSCVRCHKHARAIKIVGH